MECFKCCVYFEEWKKLLDHFQHKHKLNPLNAEYRCKYGTCTAAFYNVYNFGQHFRTHLQRAKTSKEHHQELHIGNDAALSQPDTPDISPTHFSPSIPTSTSISIPTFPSISTLPTSFSLSNSPSTSFLTSSPPTLISDEAISEPINTMKFLMNLHGLPNLTRKNVADIEQNVTSNLIQPLLSSFENYVNGRYSTGCEDRLHVHEFLNTIKNSFTNCSSEFCLLKKLKEDGFIAPLKQITINNTIDEIHLHNEVTFAPHVSKGTLLPISFQFQKLFERNDFLFQCLNEINNASREPSDHIYGDFIYSKLWQKKKECFEKSGKIALPYFLYIDDVEVNNPLGSHAAPVTMIYYAFPFSNKSEIFLAATLKGKDYKSFGNFKSLSLLVHELKKLEEEGIAIQTSRGTQVVHFVLGLIVGDNLGVNTVLGFGGFSSNHFCRFCKEHKTSTQSSCGANASHLRTVTNYETDIAINNFSLTGIHEMCVFHSLNSFHVTSNFSVDVMHDVFEGICHYDLQLILNDFINVKHYFTLDLLNSRKRSFVYGELENGNKSGDISPDSIQKSSCKFKMSAREMMCFLHFLPLMIGDKVFKNDKVWTLLQTLIKIVDILLSFKITNVMLNELETLIYIHHSEYKRLFPSSTLKPKHHHMIHYPMVIAMAGAPRNYWSFLYEANHKPHKQYARNITSRIDICVSLAKKYQLHFANSMFMQPPYKLLQTEEHRRTSSDKYMPIISKFVCDTFGPQIAFRSYSKCLYRGNKYKNGFFLTLHSSSLKLFRIEQVVIVAASELPFFIAKPVQIDSYLDHYLSYSLSLPDNDNDDASDAFILCVDKFNGPPINLHRIRKDDNSSMLIDVFRAKQYY